MQGMNYSHQWICVVLLGNVYSDFAYISPLSSEDPWSSSGYSAMLGHSPHIGQAGSFSAINPQDRMVCSMYHLYLSNIMEIQYLILSQTCWWWNKVCTIVPPLSQQNYPLHGSEVNGFHSAPTTYNHTSTINGDGIMGRMPEKDITYQFCLPNGLSA